MPRLLLILLALLPLMACSHGFLHVVPTQSPRFAGVDAIMERGIEQGLYPGGALVIGQPGRILWARAYGRQTYAPDSPAVTLDTLYDLASVTKVVGTNSMALVLLGEGRLDTEAPVEQYFEGFGANGKNDVRVRDLMTHTSGLKAYESATNVEKSRRAEESHAEALVRTYAALPTAYAPRTDFTYSCLNYQTLAHVNEVVTGERQEDFLRARVFSPAGMTDCTYNPTPEQLPRTAPTWRSRDGSETRGIVHDPLARYHGSADACPGNAGLFGSAAAVARYCDVIVRGGTTPSGAQVFDAATLARSIEPSGPAAVKELRGLGWEIYEADGYVTPDRLPPQGLVYGHLGFTGTMIWFDRRTGTYIVHLTNRTYPKDEKATEADTDIREIRKGLCTEVLRVLKSEETAGP